MSSPPSAWVLRWAHLLKPHARVLDVACGHGRHLKWAAAQGHEALGVDRDRQALQAASVFAPVLQADLEGEPWPLQGQSFDAVIVTHYLWRPLLSHMVDALAPGGVLLYETFAQGNETVGRPTRADFLLRHGELLEVCAGLQVVAYENGFIDTPPRFVQRIAAVRPERHGTSADGPTRYRLSLE